MFKKKIVLLGIVISSLNLFAQDVEKEETADMSDPMAIYTMLGGSYGSEGADFKFMSTLESDNPTGGKAIVGEAKGGLKDGEFFSDYRLRLFEADFKTGRGSSLDLMYNTESESGSITKGIMQMVPVTEKFTLYPILGAGIAFNQHEHAGINVPGAFLNFTLYSKYQLTEKIWLNYNPSYNHGIYGADIFKDNLKGEEGLNHEFIASYQINPVSNVRAYYNVNQANLDEGVWKLEYNRQLVK